MLPSINMITVNLNLIVRKQLLTCIPWNTSQINEDSKIGEDCSFIALKFESAELATLLGLYTAGRDVLTVATR